MSATPDAIPAALRTLPQWVAWRYETRDGKSTKAPINAKSNGALAYAKTNDPTTWSDLSTALSACGVHSELAGVGFCFAQDDGLTGIDLDHVIDADTGELKPEALEILERFQGTYAEVSPSGHGLRLFCYGKARRSGKNIGKVKWCEVYAHPSSRYLTVTGNQWGSNAAEVTEQQAALDWLHERFMQKPASTGVMAVDNKGPSGALGLDDAALIDKARNARNGAEFDRLWAGDTSGHANDHSAADLALCNALAFWTGGDAERIDRLFRQSGLFRAKWDKPHFNDGRTYGQGTIERAIADQRDGYGRKSSGTGLIATPLPVVNNTGPADAGADPAKLAHLFQTDLGNSERLVARYGRDLRYCFDFGKWLCWDGVRWAIDRDGAAMDKAKMTARAMLEEAATLPDREDSRKLAAWSFRSQARERMAAALFLAQSDVPVRPEHLDTQPWLLNVANGTVDLRNGQLRTADRDDLMTKAAPVVYDPNATCSEWLAFLDRIFDGNKELIRYVQKAAGYSLTGDDREQAFFVCYGVGRNGKSTLLETLAAVLGDDYAQQAAPELLMQKTHDRHPTELAALRGMRLVTAIETGEGKRLNESLVKQLTGGDRISARFMHGDFFTFTPTHKLWLATNHKPMIRGTDLGMWRRIKLIPFTVQIPEEEKDDGLKARLRAPEARQGILNWAIEGALLWQREGLKPPQAVSDATQAYREEMDVLAAWIADCCIVKKLAEAKAADLYASYTGWCEAQGERPEVQRGFGLRLVERGFEQKKRTGGTRYWLGIGLRASDSGASGASGADYDIKSTNSREQFKNVESSATSATCATNPPTDALPSHHPDSSPPVETTPTTSGEPVISQHTHKEGTPPPVRRVITVFD